MNHQTSKLSMIPLAARVCLALCVASWVHGASSAAAAPGSVNENWLAVVQQQIADEEYFVTWQERTLLDDIEAAWHAPNRAHDFRSYFTERGIRVVPRTKTENPWEWGLALVSYGRGERDMALESAAPAPARNRIEYNRSSLDEWFVNSSKGIKHGFTLYGPPQPSQDDPVHLTLVLGGNLTPIFSTDRQAIDFRSPEGICVMRYAGLTVNDATGRLLPAWMAGNEERGLRTLRIYLDDREAVYPVTVDPIATSAAWTVNGGQVDAEFGKAVATAGDVNGDGYSDVIVGARAFDNGQIDEGRAYVFHGSASGLSPVYAWYAEGNQTGANFGGAVAAAGDVNGDGYGDVIVGAKFYNNGSTDEGAAWVYHGSAAGLSATPAWSAEGNVHEVEFGCAVSSAGDVNGDGYADVLVGSWRYPYGYPLEGRAFVYYGSQSGLSTVVNWAGSGGQADGLYGFAVSGAGDVNGDGYGDFLVGARDYDGGASTTGRVFAYYGSESGPFPGWVEDGPIAYARFGAAVSAAGDVNGDGYADIIIGAPDYANPDTNEGAVYVYHGSGSGLSPDPGWQIEGNSYSMHYGQSVSTAGDVNGDGYGDVIFGGSWNAHDDEGRALVFLGSATGLKSSAVWTAEGNQIDAFLGYSVSTAGDVNGDGYSDVIVGAPWYDAALLNEGRAMVYHGSPAGLSLSTGWYAEGNQDSAYYGHAVASAGDVNGDGYADVIVGANYYDNGEVDEGRAFVYHGSETGPSTGYDWISEGNQNYAQFGYSVSGAGDVNGDGYDDVVIGARGYDNGETNEGRVYVHHGSATGLSAPADWTVESDQAFAYLGYAVSAAGDVNGDGYGDVILGAPEYDNGQTDEGRTTVYHGSRSGLSTVADWSAEGNQATANFGVAVASAGDVNGDGYSDVLVGSDKYDNLQTDEGRAFAFYGSAGGLSATPGWTAESNQASANFGFSVASAGDYDGDGYSDVIVGAWNYDDPTGLVDAGRALAYRGSPSGLIVFANWTVEGSGAYENLGYAVSGAGDVNGDGFADVIIGARRHNGGQDNEGRALVFHGSAAGLSAAAPDWSVESNQAGAYFGSAVAGAGDVNGDGYGDVLVGAQVYDNGNADEGRVWLYYGNGGRGLSLVPRQRSVTDIRPVAHLGASDSPDGFRLNLLGRTPFGVTRTKLEWEVKPLGTLFNGIESKVGVHWTPGDPAGVDLSEVETGLFDENVYHWRVRLRYDQGMTPYAQRSRWLTIPWNGWQEADLRTGDPAPAGRIPGQTGWAGQPMTIGKGDGARLVLTWDASCMDTDSDYAIYEGELGDFTTHESRYCSTGGETTRTFTPLAGDTYYIVVPMNPTREGSYGTDSNGLERPAGVGNCLPQQIGTCE